MLASETRKHARESLSGKWGKAALSTLVFALLTGIIDFILNFIPLVGSIAKLIIEIPLTFGFVVTLIKLKRGEDVTYTEFFNNGFSNFASSWKVSLWTLVKMLVPIILIAVSVVIMYLGFGTAVFKVAANSSYIVNSDINASVSDLISHETASNSFIGFLGLILFVVSSIWADIKSYYYKLTFFILHDNPNKDAKEIVEESARIMKGNRWKYFCLELSFIGWLILASFTFGIGMLWLTPYILIAEVTFYEFLIGKNNTVDSSNDNSEDTETEVISE